VQIFTLLFGILILLHSQTFAMEEDITITSPRHGVLHMEKKINSLGIYYSKDQLNLDDINSILTLLSRNPKSYSQYPQEENRTDGFVFTQTPIEIARDDRYRLKAYFRFDPTAFLRKVDELEVVNNKKDLLAQGQITFTTTFRPKNGTMGRNYTLILTVEDMLGSPVYEARDGKINIMKKSFCAPPIESQKEKNAPDNEIESRDLLEKESPRLQKKRSFSLTRKFKDAITTLSSPSRTRKTSNGTEVQTSPILKRNRSATSPDNIPSVTADHPQKKKSQSFRIGRETAKQTLIHSPKSSRSIKQPNERKTIHKSNSTTDLRSLKQEVSKKQNPITNKIIVTPLPPRPPVKTIVQNIEQREDKSK
jgi:hypothetical protein